MAHALRWDHSHGHSDNKWQRWRNIIHPSNDSIEVLVRILVSLKIIFKVQSLSCSRRLHELPWHFSFFPCTSHSPYRLIRQPFEEQSSICSHTKEKHRNYAVSAQQPIQFQSNNLISFISLQWVWCSAEPTACCVKNHRCLINFHGVGWNLFGWLWFVLDWIGWMRVMDDVIHLTVRLQTK